MKLLSIDKFCKEYKVKSVSENGNCFFESVAVNDKTFTPKELRTQLGIFYDNFQFTGKEYPRDSLAEKLQIAYITDNNEYNARTGVKNKLTHIDRIRKNYQWAGIMDIIAVAIMLKRPITLFYEIDSKRYNVETYTDSSVQSKSPILIKFDGESHFEAIVVNVQRSSSTSDSSSDSSMLTRI